MGMLKQFRERLFGRTELVPLNYGQPGCPVLQAGDQVVGILEKPAVGIVAMLCGMSGHIPEGKKVTWNVVKILSHGATLLEHRAERVFLDHMTWEDGNRVRSSPFPLTTQLHIRFYKKVPVPGLISTWLYNK